MKAPLAFELALALALALATAFASAFGAQRTALLQPGKQTLHQRVLTRPGAQLQAAPGADDGILVDAFTRYYVYGESEFSGRDWLEVGVQPQGAVSGWVDADYTVPWKQQLVVAFTNPGAQRERALLFDSWDSLKALMVAADPAALVRPLVRRISEGGRDPRVVAIEPDRFIDINSRFYLMPILDFEELFADTGHLLRGLKVASVTKAVAKADPSAGHPDVAAPDAAPAAGARPTSRSRAGEVRKLQGFRAAVVFVIDSTISMQPYIDEAREVVRRVYRRVQDARLLDRVAFGLVAFRAGSADPVRAKRLDYVARMFVNPADVASGAEFLAKASALREAEVTTDRFDEDPFAGVRLALDQIPWQRFGARYLVLITDAGALEGDDSSTGLRAEQLRSAVAAQGVGLFVLHLKTPQGKGSHAAAETQYRTLAASPLVQETLYIPVRTGSVKAFNRAVQTLADGVVEQIEQASRGKSPANQAPRTAPVHKVEAAAVSGAADDDAQTARIRRLTDALGHAMQLSYLGQIERTAAPRVFEAWISDRDLSNPTLRTIDERVLVTKQQLSDLYNILKQVLDAANAGMLTPDAFFDNLRSLAAQYTRDPNLANRPDAQSLADLGLLGEYLEGLPYQSDVMRIDLDTWSRWGTQRQLDFVNRVKSKLRLYERYNADTARWISLAEGSPPGEHVYPVPLQDLP